MPVESWNIVRRFATQLGDTQLPIHSFSGVIG